VLSGRSDVSAVGGDICALLYIEGGAMCELSWMSHYVQLGMRYVCSVGGAMCAQWVES